MSCPYCKNKTKNTYLVASDDKCEGVDAKIVRNDGIALLAVSGWYDGWGNGAMDIEPQFVPINYCPICGEKVAEE